MNIIFKKNGQSIYKTGKDDHMSYARQFEVLIGELYARKGYQVELQKTLIGRSGAEHIFDGYCIKGHFKKKLLVFEAKYSMNGSPVRIDDFSRFLTAVDDCRIPEAHMITNSYFSDNILSLAITYNIKLIDGEQLRKDLQKYGMDDVIIKNDLLNNVCIPVAKLILDSIDHSKTLSRVLLPSQQNRILYLNLDPNYSFNKNLNEKFANQPNLPYNLSFSQPSQSKKTDIEKLILIEKPKVKFSDIGGLQEVKDELRVAITYRTLYRDLYKWFNINPSSILMYGPPGCGKNSFSKSCCC
jgi:hypothetical protein